ncbi:hypothetical protein DFA_02151 [Cavenderia fasciculata]|uniref:RRM domain-containing protein n=1 Tax=Cavenderia fasciculata TaxID=261658 RepID=F4PY97_CACFS|nr:uncharacterized protein DFA_02151 [Cavenderia fasciculata]EGG19364.1 hypothetical protein DFA_02151 [Cavenderia fasciculata]|eukprot:XP_004357635.1 hypothetical protein DFA_02151 [Cavenderia fasciculata]
MLQVQQQYQQQQQLQEIYNFQNLSINTTGHMTAAATATTMLSNSNSQIMMIGSHQLDSSSGSIASTDDSSFDMDEELVITTLYVHNLDRAIPQQEVLKIFEQYGELEPNECIFFYPQRISSSYAFVRYKNRNDAEQALDAMNGAKIGSLPISIKWSDSCDQRTSIHLTFNPKLAKPGFHKQVFHKCREFGKVNHYNIPRKKGVVSQSNIYEGFGFVHFKDSLNGRCAAQDAINYFNMNDIGGVKINCCFSKKKLNVPSMPAATNAIINDLNNNFFSSQQLSSSSPSIITSSSSNHININNNNNSIMQGGQQQQQHIHSHPLSSSTPGIILNSPIAPIPQNPFSAHSLLPAADTNTAVFNPFSNMVGASYGNNPNNTAIPIRTSPQSSTHTTPNISPNVSPTFRQDKFTGPQDIYNNEYFQPCEISEPLGSSHSPSSSSSSSSDIQSFLSHYTTPFIMPGNNMYSPPSPSMHHQQQQQQQQHRKSPVNNSPPLPTRVNHVVTSPLSFYFGDSSRDKIFSENDEVINFTGCAPLNNMHDIRLSNSLNSVPRMTKSPVMSNNNNNPNNMGQQQQYAPMTANPISKPLSSSSGGGLPPSPYMSLHPSHNLTIPFKATF